MGGIVSRRQNAPMPASMNGKTCIVTGGSSGIGRATADGLAQLGADVVIVGRTQHHLDSARDAIAAHATGTVTTERCDFASLDDVRGLADRVLASHDRIDVLVNNA